MTFGGPGRVPPAMSTTAGMRPAFETWDPEGDVIAPDANAEPLYVPSIVRAPPQLPTPDQHPKREQFPPRGVKAFFGIASAELLSSSLGFVAHSVSIDNFSNQWLWFPSARRWVPPAFWGVVLAIVDGTEVAEWHLQVPTGHAAGALGTAASTVATVWYEAYLSGSSGSVLTV